MFISISIDCTCEIFNHKETWAENNLHYVSELQLLSDILVVLTSLLQAQPILNQLEFCLLSLAGHCLHSSKTKYSTEQFSSRGGIQFQH